MHGPRPLRCSRFLPSLRSSTVQHDDLTPYAGTYTIEAVGVSKENYLEVLKGYLTGQGVPFASASRVGESDTAFPHRYYHYMCGIHPGTDDPDDSEKIIQWTRDSWDAIQPFFARAVSLNAVEDTAVEGEHRVREAYGVNYDRLVALKSKYDPTNMFRLNVNIIPSVEA